MSDLFEKHSHVSWLPPESIAEVWLDEQPVPEHLCTSAFVFPFDEKGQLLLAHVRRRGLDIPGGHIEDGEDAKTAAIRECLEETGATIRIIKKIGHLRLIVSKPPENYRYPTESYQPFYVGMIEKLGPVQMIDECDQPTFILPSKAACLDRFKLHKGLIMAATLALTN